MQTSDGSMPDANLRQLYDSIQGQLKLLDKQHDDLCHSRENLTVKIVELEKMIEALSAALNSAAQHFPQPSEPDVAPYRDSDMSHYGGVGN
jgi:hypothetical protein